MVKTKDEYVNNVRKVERYINDTGSKHNSY